MLSSLGIRAYSIFIESFLVPIAIGSFNNSIFIIHTGLGQRHSPAKARDETFWVGFGLWRWYVRPAQCVLLSGWKMQWDRSPDVLIG